MSRGWESKSVEEQQLQNAANSKQDRADSQQKATNRLAENERARRRSELELQRERVLAERTSSPHRRSALENALADIEEKLAELGWSIHLNP